MESELNVKTYTLFVNLEGNEGRFWKKRSKLKK